MISAQTDADLQQELINRLMHIPNGLWLTIMTHVRADLSVMEDIECLRRMQSFFKMQIRACTSIGHQFCHQLYRIYPDMLKVYAELSSAISRLVLAAGSDVAGHMPVVRGLRAVRKSILLLISTWVKRCRDPQIFLDYFMQPLLECVVLDFVADDHPSVLAIRREAEVLVTLADVASALRQHVARGMMTVLETLLEPVLNMIRADMTSFPEHRKAFYQLLQAVTCHAFPAVIHLTSVDAYVTAVILGCGHDMSDVADVAFRALRAVLMNVVQFPDVMQQFFKAYFMGIMQAVFGVVTAGSHPSGMFLHAQILAHMFALVEQGVVTVPLGDGSVPNTAFLANAVLALLMGAFPQLHKQQVTLIVQGFFSLNQDVPKFRSHMRDFIVETREAAGEDVSALYLAERQERLMLAERDKMRRLGTVPGMFRPEDDGMDEDAESQRP